MRLLFAAFNASITRSAFASDSDKRVAAGGDDDKDDDDEGAAALMPCVPWLLVLFVAEVVLIPDSGLGVGGSGHGNLQ